MTFVRAYLIRLAMYCQLSAIAVVAASQSSEVFADSLVTETQPIPSDTTWITELSELTHDQFGDGWWWDRFDSLESNAIDGLNTNAEFPRLVWQQNAVCLLDFSVIFSQGRYRCADRADYLSGEVRWRTVVDMAALNNRHHRDWRFASLNCRDYETGPCILGVTENGTDAVYYASYSLAQQDWFSNGFELAPGRNQVTWFDDDTLLIMDSGSPDFTSSAGYPMRLEKIDRAGSRSVLVNFASDSMGGTVTWIEGELVLVEWVDFFARRYFHWRDGEFHPLNLPHGSRLVGRYRDGWLVQTESSKQPRSDDLIWWREQAENFNAATVVYRLSQREKLQQVVATDNALYLLTSAEFNAQLLVASGELVNEPEVIAAAQLEHWVVETVVDGGLVVRKETLLTGTSRWLISSAAQRQIDPPNYTLDVENFKAELSYATSSDGVLIPLLIVTPTANIGNKLPTLIDVYGGFGVSISPVNHAITSKLWLERGGRLVYAGVRGGGEYGRWWHHAGQRRYKNQTIDDLISVATSLADRGLSSPQQLAYRGASNGGLVAAAAVIRAPHVVGAVVLEAPLTDMMNYHRTLSGPSWLVEYGNPENPTESAWLLEYSPVHNIKDDEVYPPILLLAARNDDRVDIAHSRKFAQRLFTLGQPIFYDERAVGGHSIAVSGADIVAKEALIFNFLWEILADDE